MTVLKCLHANRLALGVWIAVALTPYGWVLGIANFAFLSGEGETKGIGPVTGIQVALLLIAAPATAVVLAVWAARAGLRSGRIAVVVSGLRSLWCGCPWSRAVPNGEWRGKRWSQPSDCDQSRWRVSSQD